MKEEQAREAAKQTMIASLMQNPQNLDDVFNTLWNAATEYANRWTYLPELPSEDGWYLVCGNLYTATEQTLTMALYEKGQWWALGEPAHIAVIAWRKLPEPAEIRE